jgi:hypothetical protein
MVVKRKERLWAVCFIGGTYYVMVMPTVTATATGPDRSQFRIFNPCLIIFLAPGRRQKILKIHIPIIQTLVQVRKLNSVTAVLITVSYIL